jgi:hypothetical protein
LRDTLGSLVSTVVPIASRIAETVSTGSLTDDDLAQLSRWAGLNAAERERLLGLLGRYGVRLALELADSGDPFNLVTLARRLRELSGIDELRKQIDGIQLRADALKADAALTDLQSLSWRFRLPELRNRVDRLRLDAPLLELMRMFDRCASGQIELDESRIEELAQLLTGRTLAERLGLAALASEGDLRHVAIARARNWRTYAGGGLASFQEQQVANKVDDVYMQIAFAE